MVKSKSAAEAKMRDRVSTAGKYLREGMAEGEDPIEVLMKDPEGYAKKLVENLMEAIRRGSYGVGLKRAKERDAYRKAQDRAGSHFEERTDDMVAHAMESYDGRASCIEKAKALVKGMPTKTRANRIAKSGKYQEEVGKCFDTLFGRKG